MREKDPGAGAEKEVGEEDEFLLSEKKARGEGSGQDALGDGEETVGGGAVESKGQNKESVTRR